VLIPNKRKLESRTTKLIEVATIPYSDGVDVFPIINQKINEKRIEEVHAKNK
jgi:hypothetical protein